MKYHITHVRSIPVSFTLLNNKVKYINNLHHVEPPPKEQYFNLDRMVMLAVISLIYAVILIDLVNKYKVWIMFNQ